MYDLIASWMTSGGPLQELGRDDRGRNRQAVQAAAERTTAPDRRARRMGFAFASGLGAQRSPMAATCIDGCAAC